jgi:hypothetical protein
MSDDQEGPGRKAWRATVKAVIEELNALIQSVPPQYFEAAKMCFRISLTATFLYRPLFKGMLGWPKCRFSKLTKIGGNRVLMKHQDAAPNKLATLYELAQIDERRLELLFRKKLITPQTTEKQARAMRKE